MDFDFIYIQNLTFKYLVYRWLLYHNQIIDFKIEIQVFIYKKKFVWNILPPNVDLTKINVFNVWM